MPRFALALAALLAVALSRGRGQEPGSRYVPIPVQSNFEDLFKMRLQAARDNIPLRDLLLQLQNAEKKANDSLNSLKKFNVDPALLIYLGNVDPALLGHLDLENPEVRKMLKGMMADHPETGKMAPRDLEGLKKAIDNLSRAGTKGHLPSLPPEAAAPPSPAPNADIPASRSTPRPDLLERWMRDWARRAEDTKLADWLGESPAFQRGLDDLKTLVNYERSPSSWGLDGLPEHLRLTDKLNLGLGDGILDGLKKITLPDLPRLNVPRVSLDLGNWGLPTVRLPNLGGAGGAPFWQTLLWAVIIAGAAILGWQIVSNLAPRGTRASSLASIGPWPVDPTRVATRGQLILAFDYLAILLLGAEARASNHCAIARRLGAAKDQPRAAQELAILYELARYTAGPDQLSSPDQAAARRHLCLLAGVPAS